MSFKKQVINLACNLIKCPSLTPNDAGCNKIIISYLRKIGFKTEIMQFGNTTNIWAYRGKGYTVLFAGHTDVVNIGNLKYWKFPPFEPTLNNGFLYGRGASDMKGAISAMLVASREFFYTNKNFNQGRLAFLISSDEEGSVNLAINQLIKTSWNDKMCILPPTSMQIVKIKSDSKSCNNVTPNQVFCHVIFKIHTKIIYDASDT
uniref:Succinyl-diaminopimelate desuccinylase n=1 Tax=Glossina palpalis gambiensis TaxID=67801 RepID=A0A1B0C152_9MUSC